MLQLVIFFMKILTFLTKSWFKSNEDKDQSQQIYEKQTKQTPAAEAFPNQFRIKYRPIYFRWSWETQEALVGEQVQG